MNNSYSHNFPYSRINEYQHWGKASSHSDDDGYLDPHNGSRFKIDRQTRIASAGSCFAERIAASLRRYGFNYLVVEPGLDWLNSEQKVAYGYGTYSARYGNIYTTLQLLQLFQRAYGEFSPKDDHWTLGDHVVDPFRPNIQPGGFASLNELGADREQHLAAVRRLFAEVEVFVFTLGLTETWASAIDGAAFPACPGKQFGEFDPEKHCFRNLSVVENVQYLEQFLDQWRMVNPQGKLILTVSPVPLAATMEDRHILQAATYSKCVLRVAAEEIRRQHANVDYFASYEIVTATSNSHTYFERDGRTVTLAAVEHVMWSFFRNFSEEDPGSLEEVELHDETPALGHVPCEQEQLLRLITGAMS